MYADVLFLFQWAADFCLVFLVGRLCRRAVRLRRLVTGSAVGAAAGTTVQIGGCPGFLSLVLSVPVAAAMVLVSFGRAGARPLLLRLWLLGLATGGAVEAAGQRLASSPGRGGVFLLTCGAFAVGAAFVGLIRRKASPPTVSVTVAQGAKSADLIALCDSGNLLREPISGRPVAFLSLREARSLVGEDTAVALCGPISAAMPAGIGTLRPIAVVSAGGERMTWGWRPDRFAVDGIDRDVYCVVREGSFGGFGALVPADLADGCARAEGRCER